MCRSTRGAAPAFRSLPIARRAKACHFKTMLAIARTLPALFLVCCAMPASAGTILRGQLADPVSLNIGLGCQWELSCINRHKRAMNNALKYVAKYQPPQWRIEQCNRNAQRGRERVDWIGFNQCVRNADLRYIPPAAKARQRPSQSPKRKSPRTESRALSMGWWSRGGSNP